ncbi:hypothetical protein BaRGS_00010088 [Batillaria attramentaria]|uniref:Uncharacterized protein n=1 Tax=Batillaria attramentaria TaxID=370345 RepID=A0ABD0LHI3_9CAEN
MQLDFRHRVFMLDQSFRKQDASLPVEGFASRQSVHYCFLVVVCTASELLKKMRSSYEADFTDIAEYRRMKTSVD